MTVEVELKVGDWSNGKAKPAPAVVLMVIGSEPKTSNVPQVVLPVQITDVVATVPTLPLLPTKATPCVCVGKKKLELIVVEEFEKRPE